MVQNTRPQIRQEGHYDWFNEWFERSENNLLLIIQQYLHHHYMGCDSSNHVHHLMVQCCEPEDNYNILGLAAPHIGILQIEEWSWLAYPPA